MARGEDVKTVVVTAAMIDPPAVRSVIRVKIAQIDASERLREISEAHAQVIAASMLEHEKAGGRRQLQTRSGADREPFPTPPLTTPWPTEHWSSAH